MVIDIDFLKNKKVMEDVNKPIKNPNTFANIFKAVLNTDTVIDKEKEHLWGVGLTTQNIIKYIDLISLGTLNSSLTHPREVFRLAIHEGVSALIIGHNHPSGDPSPSDEDMKITQRLVQAGKIIGIEILDHIIIAKKGYYSFKEWAPTYL